MKTLAFCLEQMAEVKQSKEGQVKTLSEYPFGFRCGQSTEDLLAKAVSD